MMCIILVFPFGDRKFNLKSGDWIAWDQPESPAQSLADLAFAKAKFAEAEEPTVMFIAS